MTRDEAIKILKELAGYEKTMDLIQNYSVSVQDALYMAIKALEQDTVTEFADRCRECGIRYGRLLNQKWIPVSERLPEENKTVIASTKYGVYPETHYTKEYGWEWAYESGMDYWRELNDVEAWMPLPEPYKAESEVSDADSD